MKDKELEEESRIEEEKKELERVFVIFFVKTPVQK